MAWFNLRTKLNPAQEEIRQEVGESAYSTAPKLSHQQAYTSLEVVNRGVNIIVDSAAAIKVDIGDTLGAGKGFAKLRKKALINLLNFSPNPYQTADVFKRNMYMDLILEGNAFLYWDGAFLYNLPANQVEVLIDPKTFVSGYKYNEVYFKPDDVIHIMENSSLSIFRGQSRLASATDAINAIRTVTDYHTEFFENGTVPGLVLSTPNNLAPRNKQKIQREWMANYSVKKGGKRPMILDGDFKVSNLGVEDPRELDFQASMVAYDARVLSALGVPPIMLSSGNNANISQNSKQFYLNTIVPLVERVTASLERFFGYDIKPILQDVIALRPELSEMGSYYSSLVNTGIMTRNEVRELLRLPKSDSDIADELILPANVAGSAAAGTSAPGGRPVGTTDT